MKKSKTNDLGDISRALGEGNFKGAGDLLLEIPGDVRVKICGMLDIQDIINIFKTHGGLREWGKTMPALWQMLYNRNFPELSLEQLRGILQIILKQPEIDISHNNYQSILFAYALVTQIAIAPIVFTCENYSDIYINTERIVLRYTLRYEFDPHALQLISNLFGLTQFLDNIGEYYMQITLNVPLRHVNSYKLIYLVYMLLGMKGWTMDQVIRNINGNCQQCGSSDVTLKCSAGSCDVLYCSQECASASDLNCC